MELALSLGDTQKPFPFLQHHSNHFNISASSSSITSTTISISPNNNKDIGFCMGTKERRLSDEHVERKGSSDPPLQLNLLPFSPIQRHPQPPPPQPMPIPTSQLRFPWLSQNLISEPVKRTLEVNNRPLVSAATTFMVEEGEDEVALSSSPNSTALSSYNNNNRMDFTSMFRKRKRDNYLETKTGNDVINNKSMEVLYLENGERSGGGGYSRGGEGGVNSDEEDINGMGRKKLRLTKDQSAFLEESFKEHNTLNPKQKLALAKQLNLRPRQVEVWFQNRRARTKLKQTEVDCEYLKRCCETLTEENRRLQKELQELRALKSSKPFYMQLPATTLTMCPSCERVASTTTTTAVTTITSPATINATTNTTLSLASS